jgi:hypothetical protein
MQGIGTSHTLHKQDTSAVAEHHIETGHNIGFAEATVLARCTGHMGRPVKEATEFQLHHNFNMDSGFMLSQAWYPLMNMLHKVKQHSDGMDPERTRKSN